MVAFGQGDQLARSPLYEELLMAFFLSIYAVSVLGFLVHAFSLHTWSKAKLIELALLYQIVFSLGVTSLVAFFGLTFLADEIAQYTGWPASPFEQQLANVNLAFGVLGILAIWLRGNFWVATVLGFSIWILGDGIHHLYHYLAHNNASAGNIGVPFWTDLCVPLILLVLLALERQCRSRSDT
jgi:hypothetical protein